MEMVGHDDPGQALPLSELLTVHERRLQLPGPLATAESVAPAVSGANRQEYVATHGARLTRWDAGRLGMTVIRTMHAQVVA